MIGCMKDGGVAERHIDLNLYKPSRNFSYYITKWPK
jgi:hypothetical protein